MKKFKHLRTEFYEVAVSMGFYGIERSSLTGKKDNVRKFWEDTFFKLLCRPYLESALSKQDKLRILDLGAGSGEGFELLTHIPTSHPTVSPQKEFLLTPENIACYLGLDLSPSMVEQGRKNYGAYANTAFERCDLNEGLPSDVKCHEPYDVYFSSYSSLSHLAPEKLQHLLEQIFIHAKEGSLVIVDVLGKFSPEWPKYWSEKKTMLPYTMAYLLSESERKAENVEWFDVCYWSAEELMALIQKAEQNAKVKTSVSFLMDRSIFVGRHIDTGLFGAKTLPLRYQVNRLFDHGYRGEVEHLKINLDYLGDYKQSNETVWRRLTDYEMQWDLVIALLEALMRQDDKRVKEIIETTEKESLAEDMKFLAWLYRNRDRFPVVDFWASMMGPQIACVLRNIEMALPSGLGCGHGLLCGIEVKGK